MAAPLYFDRVRETSATTGTGAITPGGAYDASFQTIGSVLSSGDTAYFAAKDTAGNWQVFLGTWNGTTVARTTGLAGTNGTGNTTFGAGLGIWIDAPAAALQAMLNTSTIMFAGVPLTGARYVSASLFSLASGNNDIYTPPSGKKAVILSAAQFINDTGAPISAYAALKRGGTYYRLQTTAGSVTDGTTGSVNASFVPVLTSSDTFAINATAANAGVVAGFIEFDATVPLATAIITSVAGTNTLYTCPSGKTARILAQTGDSPALTTGTVVHSNTSGGAITRNVYWVPSGGSPSAQNEVTASGGVSAANNAVGTTGTPPVLSAGDFISVSLSGTGATQMIAMNYYEV